MKLIRNILLLLLVRPCHSWTCISPRKIVLKKVQSLARGSFIAGAVGGLAVGTVTAAGTAIALNQANNNRPIIYKPKRDSLTDQVIIITGGTSGLGLESAKRLAAGGATIVLTSRTEEKGKKAAEEVREYLTERDISDAGKVFDLVLDLDSLDSVKAFAGSYANLNLGSINVLLNNAGVMALPSKQLTEDGYEKTFQSNHLGHFVLTSELFPFLSREKSSVINVSSEAYQLASLGNGRGLDINNLNGEIKYGPWSSYGLSKLANILFTQELQKRADAAGQTWLTVATLHPGGVNTNLWRNLIGEEKWKDLQDDGSSALESFLLRAASSFSLTTAEGASTQIFLASGGDGNIKKAGYYDNLSIKDLPQFATDAVAGKKLWDKSEELSGILFMVENIKEETDTGIEPEGVEQGQLEENGNKF